MVAGSVLAAVGAVLLLVAWLVGRSRPRPPADAPTQVRAHQVTGSGAVEGRFEGPDLPIADYDRLWVTQIVPLLAGLSPDQLRVVEGHEQHGRQRTGVLAAIGSLLRGDVPLPRHPTTTAVDPAEDVFAPPGRSEAASAGPGAPPAGEGPAAVRLPDHVVRMPTFLGRPAAPVSVRR